jgi:hypothetical protein
MWQTAFLGLQFLWQFSSPRLQPHVYLTKSFELSLLPFRLVHVDGIVEEVHQVTGDLAQLGNLQGDCARPGRLRMCLTDSRVCHGTPSLGVFVGKHFKLGDRDDGVVQLRQPAEVVTPALVEQEAAPESDAPGVLLVLVHVAVAVHAEIEAKVARHAEAHAAVHPALGLSAAPSFSHGHEGECLHGRECGNLVQIALHDQPLGLLEEMVAGSCRVVADSTRARPRGEVTAQGQHGVDQQRGAVLHPAVRSWRRAAELELVEEQALGQGGEEAVVPAKVHADEVLHELWVRGGRRPRAEGVLVGLVLVRVRVGRVCVVVGLVEIDQVRSAANVARRPVLQAQLAHLAAQLALKGGLSRAQGRRGRGADLVVVVELAILLGEDVLGDGVEALAGADLVDQVGHVVLRVVEDGLDQRLQGRVARLEVVDVLLVDALAAVVRVEVVDALGVVDGGAG